MFAEKMASIVGPSYVAALASGAVYGLTQTPQAKYRRTTRILLNTYINNVGKTGSRWANNTAAAVFLYVVIGKLINHVFLEEFEDLHVPEPAKVAIYGGVTGAVYKSTRGVRPMMLGSVLGGLIGSSYAYVYMRWRFSEQ